MEGERIRAKQIITKQTILQLLLGEGILLGLNVLCYKSVFWMLPLQLFLIPYMKVASVYWKRKNHHIYLDGFKELLASLMTSMQAGYSFENACRLAIEEMGSLYKSNRHPMVKQMQILKQGLVLHIPAEVLFSRFAEDTGVQEAYQLSVLLSISNKMGNNLVAVLKDSMESLQERMTTAEEIEVMLSGKILEKNIMLLMPFGMILYMQLCNPGYLDFFFGSFVGHLSMTVLLAITLACYFWTEKIMDIGND